MHDMRSSAIHGDTKRAIELCCKMQQDGLVLSYSEFLCSLKACGKKGSLSHGQLIHDQIVRVGHFSDLTLGSTLVDMYAKCGCIAEAQKVFDDLPNQNVVTWNAMIAGYANVGQGVIALELYGKMKQTDIKPAKVTFLCILKACSSLRTIVHGNLIHDEIIRSGLDSDVAVGNTLVDMYAKCEGLQEALKVFDKLLFQDVVSWNSMISGYTQHGHGTLALELFSKMQQAGITPDIITFSCIFKACSSIEALEEGKKIHMQLLMSRLEIDMVIGSTLVDMYVKCGSLEEAYKVFDGFPNRNSTPWGTIIAGYAQHGQYFRALELFGEMQHENIKPGSITFLCILKACACIGALGQGMIIHNQILRNGLELDTAVGNALIDMYAKFDSLSEAEQVFHTLPNRSVVSWNSIIAGYAQYGHSFTALQLFEKMQKEGIQPDKVTFLGILKARDGVGAIGQGKKLHQQIIISGLESDVMVGSTLVDMYAKWGKLKEAREVFNRLPQDVVACGAMIAGYIQHGHVIPALRLFQKMHEGGIEVDNVVFACVLKACGSMEAMYQGQIIHEQIVRHELENDLVIGNALIDMYAKCGSIMEARNTFDALPSRNVVSWNTLMAGYAQDEDGHPTLQLYERMLQEGMKPEKVSFLCVLKACGSIGTIESGKLIHDHIIRSVLELDLVVGNTIVDMYAKCGNLEEARKIFDELPARDVVSWSAMIAGYAQHGDFRIAEQYLDDMRQLGLKPVSKTFTSILVACSHAGQVEGGCDFFKSMRENYGITPSIEHFNCMIDLLGRAGFLKSATELVLTMPYTPNISGWMSLLTSCRTFGNMELGRKCFNKVVQLSSSNSAAYMLMSKIYADAHMWGDIEKLEELRKSLSAWKKPGMAWIELKNKVHEFIVQDTTHQHFERVCAKLKISMKVLKKEGYVPQLDSLLEQTLFEDGV